MNRSMVTGIVVGASIAVAGAVMANYVMRDDTATGGEAVEIAATDTSAPSTAAAGTSATAPTPWSTSPGNRSRRGDGATSTRRACGPAGWTRRAASAGRLRQRIAPPPCW